VLFLFPEDGGWYVQFGYAERDYPKDALLGRFLGRGRVPLEELVEIEKKKFWKEF
jgi:hypothetical protein